MHVACSILNNFYQNPNIEDTNMLDVSSRRQVSSDSIEFSDEDDLSNVNVKSLVSCQHWTYCSTFLSFLSFNVT